MKYVDLAVLDQLVKAGANLDEPRHVLHYLYFPSRSAAEAAAGTAQDAGYQPEVRDPMPQFSGQWSLVCERQGIVTDLVTVRDTTDFFEQVVAADGGEYDGWEASA
ncbi:MAG: ribonuclease E inhibitor RraB [Actinobacteria bacterium]|nr:ribonuclease E inhibitor RraB [Actinomycetota bacterium]